MADADVQAASTPALQPTAQHFAVILEQGRIREVDAARAKDEPRGDTSLLWMHLHGPDQECQTWLALQDGVPDAVRRQLTAAETRPRCEPIEDGALVNLRGPGDAESGSDPLVSVRMWVQRGRVISVVRRRLTAIDAVHAGLQRGTVSDPGDLVAAIATAISTELDRTIADLGDRLDDVEEQLAVDENADLRRDTNTIRGQAIGYRRFVAPERVALHTLAELPCDWLDEKDRTDLKEAANRFARMTEELDAIHDRAALVSEQLAEARAAVLERRSFALSVVALIFLPLTFLTGLLGINVEGIWYADRPWAFNAVVAICAALATLLSTFFIVKRWLSR